VESKNTDKTGILIVEDNPAELEYCAALIEEMNLDTRIFRACTGMQAFKLLSEESVDAIFIDVGLPDTDGFRLAAEIRKLPGHSFTSIVFVTGDDADQLSVHKKYHYYEYIVKPFTSSMFVSKVKPLLESLEEEKEMRRKEHRIAEKVVVVEAGHRNGIVPVNDIYFAETGNREIILYTCDCVYEGIRMRMNEFVDYVNSPGFRRCHKSYAVNVDNIVDIENFTKRLWCLRFHKDIPFQCFMSRTYYDDIMEIIKMRGLK